MDVLHNFSRSFKTQFGEQRVIGDLAASLRPEYLEFEWGAEIVCFEKAWAIFHVENILCELIWVTFDAWPGHDVSVEGIFVSVATYMDWFTPLRNV